MNPLVEAVKQEDQQAVKQLILENADVNGCDENERSPLWHAAAREQAGIAALLLANGARSTINKADTSEVAPLSLAVQMHSTDLTKLLILEGAKLTNDIRTKMGATAPEITEMTRLQSVAQMRALMACVNRVASQENGDPLSATCQAAGNVFSAGNLSGIMHSFLQLSKERSNAKHFLESAEKQCPPRKRKKR